MTSSPSTLSRLSTPNEGVWIDGIPPIKRIVLIWNGKGLFGPIAFQSEENRDENLQRIICMDGPISGPVTHFLIVPKGP